MFLVLLKWTFQNYLPNFIFLCLSIYISFLSISLFILASFSFPYSCVFSFYSRFFYLSFLVILHISIISFSYSFSFSKFYPFPFLRFVHFLVAFFLFLHSFSFPSCLVCSYSLFLLPLFNLCTPFFLGCLFFFFFGSFFHFSFRHVLKTLIAPPRRKLPPQIKCGHVFDGSMSFFFTRAPAGPMSTFFYSPANQIYFYLFDSCTNRVYV